MNTTFDPSKKITQKAVKEYITEAETCTVKHKVYMAGKIAKNDWRHTLVPGLGSVTHSDQIPFQLSLDMSETITYVGPYFIACDHGCNHGQNSHGRGIGNEYECNGGDDKQGTFDKCIQWINDADAIFAYITHDDAYGTLFELGYAYSQGKPIFVCIPSDLKGADFIKDMWFPLVGAAKVSYAKDVETGYQSFASWLKTAEVDRSGNLNDMTTYKQFNYAKSLYKKYFKKPMPAPLEEKPPFMSKGSVGALINAFVSNKHMK